MTFIIDGTDNFFSRYLINDACVLFDRPLIHGSIKPIRRYGNRYSTIAKVRHLGASSPTALIPPLYQPVRRLVYWVYYLELLGAGRL